MSPGPSLDALLWQYLLWVLLPLWLAAGFGDYLCHRRSRIEHTSGTHESLLHCLMVVEVGVPVLLVLFFRVNALVLAVGAVAVILHAATSWADLRWSDPRRRIAPVEQVVHSVLELVPFVALSLLALLHWDQAQALLGRGGAPDFALHLQPPPLLPAAALLGASALLAVLPFAEELWRCLRVGHAGAPTGD